MSETCKHCNRPIEIRTAEWPPEDRDKWVHLQAEGTYSRSCFGYHLTDAEPVLRVIPTPGPDDMVQIVMTYTQAKAVESFLEQHGRKLFPIPVEDDLPTFEIQPIRDDHA